MNNWFGQVLSKLKRMITSYYLKVKHNAWKMMSTFPKYIWKEQLQLKLLFSGPLNPQS